MEFLQAWAKTSVSIKNLHIYANGEHLEFLQICTDLLVLEFLQKYTKNCASLNLKVMTIKFTHMVRRSSNLEFLGLFADTLNIDEI